MKRVVHAACPHDCPDACGVLITVEDGIATRIEGDPAHPVTRGFLCGKVAKYLDRVYAPDRVLYPLRRVRPKGKSSGAAEDFVRISWDKALDEIAARYRRIIAEFGAEAILPYSYGGTLGALNGGSMDRRFFHRLGASRLERTICSEAGERGLKSVIGAKLGTEPEQFVHARLIIAWAANIHANNIHLWPFIEEARRKGARLIVIDPYRTRTAASADWHLAVNPGTDVALALGLMHVIIGEGLHDADYVERHTLGFEELRRRVLDYPPERVAQWTGIAADDVRRLAREYATTRPAVIRLNYGVQRCENGGTATRAIAMLPCITGSWKDAGGGLLLSTSGAYGLNRVSLERPDLDAKTREAEARNSSRQDAHGSRCGTRVINMVELGRELNTRRDPPIQALFVYNSNPATTCPNHNEVVRGLLRPDLFTVVHEQFLTDTCDYADLVLPATTFFEHKDLQTSYGHYYLQISHAAIAPLGECRSNVETFRALAYRMGFDEPCFSETTDEMIDLALDARQPWREGITREGLEREGHVRLNLPSVSGGETAGAHSCFLPFANGNFPTASGKAELASDGMLAVGLDAVATFAPPQESRNALTLAGEVGCADLKEQAALRSAPKFCLELLARKPENFLNSTFANLPAQQRMEQRARQASASESGDLDVLEMHAADAAARAISTGDMVRVFNDRGEVRLRARVYGAATGREANGNAENVFARNSGEAGRVESPVPPGVVAARLNWARLSGGGSINALTSDRLSDMGGGATFYSALVEVERI